MTQNKRLLAFRIFSEKQKKRITTQKCLHLVWVAIFLLLSGCTTIIETTSAEQFTELNTQITAGEFGDIKSLIIWHDGTTELESYYQGTDQDTLIQVYSVTKSITSAMIGKALEEQKINSLDDPVLPLFADYEPIENLDGHKEAITIENLLTMQAGLEWNELSTSYEDENNDISQLYRHQDWINYVLDREMVAAPGTQFTYNSGVTMLLGSILEQATGQTVEAYTAVNLFTPLGITEWQWENTPQKLSNTGWGLHLRPADMLKFGQLYLQQGNWQGKQIIPQDWVTQSTQPSVYLDDYNYGYQWWRFADDNPIIADLAQNDLYFAWGYGGNFIFIVPHLDLIVVTTAENFEESALFFSALSDHIFPAYD